MTLTPAQIEELEDKLDRPDPEAWRWEDDGLRVIGAALRLERIQTKDYGEALSLIIEVQGQERRILLTTVLRGKLQRLNVRSGEPIGIERDEQKTRPASGGAPYWNFRARTLKNDSARALNWEDVQALPESTVDAEVVDDDQYEIQHMPRDGKGGW